MPFALDAVDDHVVGLVGERVGAAEACMEICRVDRHIGQRVVDLVVDARLDLVEVGERDATVLAERHFPVAVEGATGIDADRQGVDGRIVVA